MRRPARFILLIVLVALGVPTAAFGFALREFPTGTGAYPAAIVPGADGTAWFTDADGIAGQANGIDRIDAYGKVQRFPFPSTTPGFPGVLAIASAADGGVWFIGSATTATINHLSPSGRVTAFSSGADPAPGHHDPYPNRLAAGRDGGVWYTDEDFKHVGHLTASGRVDRFALPKALWHGDSSTAVGRDGRLWLTSYDTSDVYAVDTHGRVARYPLGVADRAVLVAAGPDGRIWVETQDGTVVRMTTKGVLRPLPLDLHAPSGSSGEPPISAMVAGPGNRMWMTLLEANEIVDVTPGGRVTHHGAGALGRAGVPYAGYAAGGIATTSGDHLWVAEPVQGRVALVTTGPSCGVPALIGHTEAYARATLRAAGCRASFVPAGAASANNPTVTSQSIKAGRVVSSRAVVRLRLGHAPIACRLPADARVVHRGPDVVIAHRRLSTPAAGGWDDYWIGCASSTGHLTNIVRGRAFEGEKGYTTITFRSAGTHVAFLTTANDHYDLPGSGVTAIHTMDLATAGTSSLVVQRSGSFGLVDFAISPQGAVAWIDYNPVAPPQYSLRLWIAGTTTTLDVGNAGALADLGIDADAVHWTSAGEAKDAPITAP